MGVFQDLFSNKPAKDAAAAKSAALTTGLTNATGTLNQGYGDASQYLEKIPGYLDTAKGYLGGAQDYLTQAASRFDPLTPTAQQGFTQYGSLYGLGGADPTAAVRAQPGYQFSQDEGREAVMRSSLGTGATGLQSGNTLQSIFDRGANIADTKWQQYAEGLKPFLQLAPMMAQIQGGYDAQKGAYEGQKGGYEAQKAGYATGQAGLETELAKALSGLQYGTASGIGDSLASAELARGQAAKNVFDAVKGAAELGVKAFTGGAGGAPSPAANFKNMFAQG